MKIHRFAGLVLFLLAVMAALLIGYTRLLPDISAPNASKGILDLSGWDLEQQGQVYLNGEWELYKSELLYPADFINSGGSRHAISYFQVPLTWKSGILNRGMPPKGYATYHLKVILNEPHANYGLKISNIRMSHRLFLNGSLAGESGVPAAQPDTYEPGNTPYTVYFTSDSRELDIVIQVANYVFPTGGIVNGISFGLNDDISRQNDLEVGSSIGLVMILVILAIYNLALYYIGGMEDRIYLYIGLFLLASTCLNLLYEEKIMLRFVPDLPFMLVFKTIELMIFLSFIFYILILCNVNKNLLSPQALRRILLINLVYCLAVLVLPYRWHMSGHLIFLYFNGCTLLYLIVKSLRFVSWMSGSSSKRIESLLLLVCSLSIALYCTGSALYGENLVSNNALEKGGLLAFILFLQLLLTFRLTDAIDSSKQLARQLQRSNQLKDEFLTNTTHELKTPLNGIMNTASFLLEDQEHSLSDNQKSHLRLITDTSTKLSMLIRDLVDVTNIKYNDLRLHMSAVDVRVAVQTVLDLLRFELGGRPVALINEVEPDIRMSTDDNRLRQVLYNLVHNAIRHTEEGCIRVISEQVNGQVVIIVEDTGSGIPESEHERIFNYFESIEPVDSRSIYVGMGVGLYISRQLVERMGGSLGVERSVVGQGTRMKFFLPKAESPEVYKETAAAAERSMLPALPEYEQRESHGTHEHTILIIDDEAINIHVLLNLLASRYRVITASSAKEAEDKLSRHPETDLVILDVMLPGMSGIELCRKLRTRHSILELPILLATVKDSAQDIVLGFDAGANDYIAKPFEGSTLLARVQTLISLKASLQEALMNEYAFYQAQINPHFLNNALTSVIAFCYTNPEQAVQQLTMLSRYMRYILETTRSGQDVPLKRELELIETYVGIEKARFEGRFDYFCNVEESLVYIPVPSLCIQPFVENSIRHGMLPDPERLTVTVDISGKRDGIEIMIQDNGAGMTADQLEHTLHTDRAEGGIGVLNVKKRLSAMPGARLDMESSPGGGTRILIFIKYQDSL